MPITTPVLPTVEIVGALLLQIPPGEASDRVIDCPTHTYDGPVIGAIGLIAGVIAGRAQMNTGKK